MAKRRVECKGKMFNGEWIECGSRTFERSWNLEGKPVWICNNCFVQTPRNERRGGYNKLGKIQAETIEQIRKVARLRGYTIIEEEAPSAHTYTGVAWVSMELHDANGPAYLVYGEVGQRGRMDLDIRGMNIGRGDHKVVGGLNERWTIAHMIRPANQ